MGTIQVTIPADVEAELNTLADHTGIEPGMLASEAVRAQLIRVLEAVSGYRAGRFSLGGFADRVGLGVVEADCLLKNLGIMPRVDSSESLQDADKLERLLGGARP